MLLMEYLRWWYGPGWRDSAQRLLARLRKTYYSFSVPILVPTMFAPWKRITSYSSGSLGDRLRASLDNLVSRAVGFGVRLCALVAAFAIMGFSVVIGGLVLLLWPLLPALGPLLVVGGLL
jgi:hypothetical protein